MLRKKTKLWKILTGIFAILLVVFLIGTFVANSYRAVIDTFFDISPYKIVQGGRGRCFCYRVFHQSLHKPGREMGWSQYQRRERFIL